MGSSAGGVLRGDQLDVDKSHTKTRHRWTGTRFLLIPTAWTTICLQICLEHLSPLKSDIGLNVN